MSEYRSKLKNRSIMMVIFAVLSLTIVISGVLLAEQMETDSSTYMDGMVKGFPVGLFMGFLGLMIFSIVRCIRALQNESALKEMYISENDERGKTIRQSAMDKSFFFTTGILTVGVTVASFFNNMICVTLAVVLLIHVLVGAILKLYYSLKY